MAAKYEPLARLLTASHPQPVTLTFDAVDRLIGGLPPSARGYREWWGNRSNPAGGQSAAWIDEGYLVERVRLGVDVTFVVAAGPRPVRVPRAPAQAKSRLRPILDGIDQLTEVLRRAGYPSIVAAVAEHSVFLHPETVAQAKGAAIFATVRWMGHVGEFEDLPDGRRVMLDDNLSPTVAFTYAANLAAGRDVQFNHVWPSSKNPDAYTALWNLFATPAFLAKPTDTAKHPEVRDALRFRAFDLYGRHPADQPDPVEPAGYRDLTWAAHPALVPDLEAVFRTRLRSTPKSRPAIACRKIGWLFSGWKPDPAI
jgi:hypothetical protein